MTPWLVSGIFANKWRAERESGGSFSIAARRAAAAWKSGNRDLPPEARLSASYDEETGSLSYVLPIDCRWHNLMPQAREAGGLRSSRPDRSRS
jgi:hypothetical protein